MIILRKEENWYGYDNVIVETDEGMFEILYSGNDDLYFSLMYVGQRLDIPDSYSFSITKDNEYLYNSFEKLYNSIRNNKPFSNSRLDDINRNMIVHDNKLFKNGRIEWHSDDFSYDEASILTIYKEKDIFKVEFKFEKLFSKYIFSDKRTSIFFFS